jgi:ATP-dependent protease ClpP protease subunit
MSIKVDLENSEIMLSGVVGGESDDELWWGVDGFNAGDVINALASFGRDRDITVRINSPGGIATEGAAIHASLSAHRGKITMIVDGVAASAASLIFMAGDVRTMSLGAVLMIHDPAGFTWGDVREHEKTIECLNALGDAYAGIYSDASGKSLEDCRAIMKEETWFTGEQAVAAGFADGSDEADAGEDEPVEPAAFAYHQLYSRAPDKLVALAQARGWKTPVARLKNSPAGAPTANVALGAKPSNRKARTSMSKTPPTASLPAAAAAPAAAPSTTAAAPEADAAVTAAPAAVMNLDEVRAAARGDAEASFTARAREINELCALAQVPHLAGGYIADSAKSAEVVRAEILKARADGSLSAPTMSQHGLPASPAQGAAAAASWDHAVSKVNAQMGFAQK